MKRLVCLLLSLVMVLGLLAGCGSSSETTEETETTETEEASAEETAAEEEEEEEETAEEASEEAEEETAAEEETEGEEAEAEEAEEAAEEEESSELPGGTTPISMPLTEEGITITYFMRFNPQVQDYVQDMSDNLFYAVLEELSGVSVEFQLYHPSVVEEQFNLQIAAQNYCDIYCEYGASYTGGLDGAVDDEVFLDLSDYIEEYMPNYYSYLAEDDENIRSATTDSGKYVAIYAIYEPHQPSNTGPLIRADWAEEAGLDVETMCTYDEYETYVKYAYETYGATVYLTESGAPSFNYLISGYGVSYAEDGLPLAQKDGEIFCTLLDDGMREYLSMISEWYANGWIYQDFFSEDTSVGGGADSGMVTAGETSLWWGETSYISQYEEDATDEGFKIAAIQDAVKEAGDQTHFAQTNFGRVSSAAYVVISTACEYPEIAMQWMDYRYTQEGYLLANYGVEGETYEFDEDGQPQYLDLIVNNPEGMTTTLAQWRYMLQNTVCLSSVDAQNQGLTEYELGTEDIWMTNKDDEWSIPSAASMTTDEATEYNAISADLTTYISTCFLQFITGTLSVEDDYDDFVDTLYDMGIEDCIAIYQDALDRYYTK